MPRPQLFSFANTNGQKLAAILDLPDQAPVGYALFAHCFTCSKDIKVAHWIGQRLASLGLAMLRFDFAGVGGSSGAFVDTRFSTNIDDILAAVAFLRQQYRAPSLLIGHSFGGTAMLAAAPLIPEVSAVVTLSAALRPAHLRTVLAQRANLDGDAQIEIQVAGRRVLVDRAFLAELDQYDLETVLAQFKPALLVVHAVNDAIVGIDEAEAIFATAPHPKGFISLPTADHLLSQRAVAEQVAELIYHWARPFVIETVSP